MWLSAKEFERISNYYEDRIARLEERIQILEDNTKISVPYRFSIFTHEKCLPIGEVVAKLIRFLNLDLGYKDERVDASITLTKKGE